MSEGILTSDGKVMRPSDGQCKKCGGVKDTFKPVMGGLEVCMNCGHQRKSNEI
jgi:hypothetical protein